MQYESNANDCTPSRHIPYHDSLESPTTTKDQLRERNQVLTREINCMDEEIAMLKTTIREQGRELADYKRFVWNSDDKEIGVVMSMVEDLNGEISDVAAYLQACTRTFAHELDMSERQELLQSTKQSLGETTYAYISKAVARDQGRSTSILCMWTVQIFFINFFYPKISAWLPNDDNANDMLVGIFAKLQKSGSAYLFFQEIIYFNLNEL